MDIKQINDIKSVVEYNNKSALTRIALSPTWVIGVGFGSVVYFAGAVRGKISPRKGDVSTNSVVTDKLYTNMAYSYPAVTELCLSPIFAESATIATLSSVLSAYSGLSFAADLFGLGTGKCLGAMRAGYAQGKMGGTVTDQEIFAAEKAQALNKF